VRRVTLRLLTVGWVLATLSGCAATANSTRLLNLIGLTEKPLIISYVAEKTANADAPLAILNPFANAEPLHQAMSKDLRRQTAPYLCLPFQLEFDLELGICQLAVISPVQYAALRDRSKFTPLAVSQDVSGRAARSGLLIATAESPIASIKDVKSKIVAFGPPRDGRTHHAALLLLSQNGIAKSDLALELFPVPGSLRTYPRSGEVADSVMRGQSEAGFIDEMYWDLLPDKDAGLGQPSKDRFKIIGRTIAVPERIVLASPKLDVPTREAVKKFFLSTAEKHPDVLTPLKFAGYAVATSDVLDAATKLRDANVPTEPPQQ